MESADFVGRVEPLPAATRHLTVADLYREMLAKDPAARLFLSVCCGREQLSSAEWRFCQRCGKQVRGDLYRLPETQTEAQS